jgi:hypothetical protein
MRYLWDLIDGSTDNGQDNVDLTVGQFASVIYGMPCTAGDRYGCDGDCNEPNRGPGSHNCISASCNPTSELGPEIQQPLPWVGTRDSHNVWDLSQRIAEQITGVFPNSERVINCVDGARD